MNASSKGDNVRERLRRFHAEHFRQSEAEFRSLVERGQDPHALFIACSDSRVVPHLLVGAEPGDLFVVRNVGAIVPPYGSDQHGTAAAVEYAVLALDVRHIVVCAHTHCGAMAALYRDPDTRAKHLCDWLEYARDAAWPTPESESVLRRTEQRIAVLGLERLLEYPVVSDAVERGALALHGWHYVIEEGKVLAFDAASGQFHDMVFEG